MHGTAVHAWKCWTCMELLVMHGTAGHAWNWWTAAWSCVELHFTNGSILSTNYYCVIKNHYFYSQHEVWKFCPYFRLSEPAGWRPVGLSVHLCPAGWRPVGLSVHLWPSAPFLFVPQLLLPYLLLLLSEVFVITGKNLSFKRHKLFPILQILLLSPFWSNLDKTLIVIQRKCWRNSSTRIITITVLNPKRYKALSVPL